MVYCSRMKYLRRQGFTLIELLVVIAIIGLLSTLAVVALNGARSRARDSRRVSDIHSLQTALELYFADQGGYPIEAGGITLGLAADKVLCAGDDASGFLPAANGAGGCDADGSPGATLFMGLVPTAPAPADENCSATENSYEYLAATANTYSLTFCLGRLTGTLSAGIRTATPDGIN